MNDSQVFYGSGNADYIAARLRRDHPEIAAAVERGEYLSIRAAGIAAGIVKPRPARKSSSLGTPDQLADRVREMGPDYVAALVAALTAES